MKNVQENLQRAHHLSMKSSCRNSYFDTDDTLAEPLTQFIKSGASKPAQRLKGIFYALLVENIAAMDTKANKKLAKEKI